jgi:hypothetical protein
MSAEQINSLPLQHAVSNEAGSAGIYAALPHAPEINDEPVEAARLSSRQKIGKAATALAAAVSVGMTSIFIAPAGTSAYDMPDAVEFSYPDNSFPQADQDPKLLYDYNAGSAVNALLAQPETSGMTYLEYNVSKIMQKDATQDYNEVYDRELFKVRKQVAAANGVVVFDPTDTKKILRANLYPNAKSALPAKEYIATANHFLQQYDVKLTVDHKIPYFDNMRPASNKTLDTMQTRDFILSAVDTIAAEPKEYADTLGIKRYLLAEQIPGKKDEAGGYIFPDLKGPGGAAVVINVSDMSGTFSNDTVNHEQSHRLDYLETAGAEADPQFEVVAGEIPYGKYGPEPKLNKPDTRPLNAERVGYVTMDTLERKKQAAYQIMSTYYNQPNCADEAIKTENALQEAGRRVVLTTDYSGSENVVERKAELMRNIPEGDNYPRMLSPLVPHIAEQFKFALTRLYTYRSRIARFFIQMARHPSAEMYPNDDNLHMFEDACAYVAAHPNDHGK